MSAQPKHSAGYAPPALTADSTIRDYIGLLKPRVMSLVVFTGFCGMALAPGASAMHPFLAAVAVFCIALASGAAGAVNMWYDRDIDARMKRTRNRALPQGRVPPDDALAFGVVLTLLSVLLMGVAVNWVAAGLLAAASLFYIFIYTIWLKRRTPQNIVIGGAAGAFPPMIGWAAVTGSVSFESLLLFALIFFWTPPHFWALALYRNADYKRAGVPMLPVVAGDGATRKQIMVYTGLLAVLSVLPYAIGMAGLFYLAAAAVLNALFLRCAWHVLRATDGDFAPARRMFAFSIFYLFALFAALTAGALWGAV
ncbi:MAG: protoheme IX farnesyltransferase [Micavibrio sp.]|nr:MAG: protoheme IX farnesyltransferase [Micavibrio sp.]